MILFYLVLVYFRIVAALVIAHIQIFMQYKIIKMWSHQAHVLVAFLGFGPIQNKKNNNSTCALWAIRQLKLEQGIVGKGGNENK